MSYTLILAEDKIKPLTSEHQANVRLSLWGWSLTEGQDTELNIPKQHGLHFQVLD